MARTQELEFNEIEAAGIQAMLGAWRNAQQEFSQAQMKVRGIEEHIHKVLKGRLPEGVELGQVNVTQDQRVVYMPKEASGGDEELQAPRNE